MNPLLAKLLQSVADPQLPGPLNNLPAPVKRLLPVLAGPIGQVASPGYQVGAPLVKRALGLEGDIAKGIAGYAALPALAVQADTGDPNNTTTKFARSLVGQAEGADPAVRRALLLQYLRHPGRQTDLLRESPDPVTSWLAGALELASHPLNYTGGVGEFGRGLEEGAPLVGGAIKHAATAGEVVNRIQALPMIAPFLVPGAAARLWRGQELASPALRALTTAPEWERAVQAGAGGAERAASEALQAALDSPTMRRLRDAPGLPPAATPEALASAKVGPSKALGLPLTPEPVDLRLAQRELGLPQVTALPRLPASPLEAVRTPNLLAIAKRAERAARPALAPTEAAPDLAQVLPELAQAKQVAQALPPLPLPEIGGVADRAALGALAPKEIDTLVDLAYPHDNALNNAMAKYTDDATLAGAAWDRVTKNPDLVQRLVSIDEPLARKLALLPEREGAALPDATPEQLAELIAQGGDIAAGGGGGGLGIIPRAGGRFATAGAGTALGLGTGSFVGGLLPADSEEQRRENIRRGGIIGGGIGLGLGLGVPAKGVDPHILGIEAGRFARPVDKAAIDTTRIRGPQFGTPKAWTPEQNAVIDKVMEIKKARAPQDIADLKALALDHFISRNGTAAGFDQLWDSLTQHIAAAQVLEVGYGADAADMARVVESGLGKRAGFDPALGNYDDLIGRKMGRVRGHFDEQRVKDFVDVEAAAHENLGIGNPLHDPNAPSPIYASLTEGQPSGMEMGGTFRQFLDLEQQPRYLVTLHHHYLTAAKVVEDFHAKTRAAVKNLWGPENEVVRQLLGRGDKVPVGDTGNTMLDTPLIVHPDAGPAARAAMLILSTTEENLKRATQVPDDVAVTLLRGQKMRGNASGSERVTQYLGGQPNLQRSEALLFDQDPKFVKAMAYGSPGTKEDARGLALTQKYLDQFGIGDRPIYRMRGPEGVPDVLPPDISPGRGAIVDAYKKLGLEDIGIVPYPGGINGPVARAVERGAIGGTAGLVAGAGIGAATNEDDRAGGALSGALKGAGIGVGLGAGSVVATPALGQLGSDLAAAAPPLLRDTMVDPGMWADAIKHGWESFQAVRAQGRGAEAKGIIGPGNKAWRAQVVNTLKQLPQDALTRAFIMWGVASKEFGAVGADLRRWQGILRGERAAGQPSPTNPLTQKLRALGRRDVLSELGETYGVDFGSATASDAAGEYLGPGGRAATGALIGMGSALKTVNPIAPLYGAARGYAAPFVDGMIRFMNAIQHDAFRYALGEKALDRDIPRLAQDFLSELARQGHDVRPLEGRGGFFSPEEVARVAGGQAGKDWDLLTLALIKRQGDRIAFLGGDFRKSSTTKFEQGLGKVVPYSQWSIRYAPVLAEVAARHPRAATLAAAELGREQRDAADKGLQPYQAGAVTIDTETPGLGAAVRARLGGAKGKMTLDPLGALVPYGDILGSPPATDQEQTPYQKVTGLLGRVGFQPHPLVKDVAYMAGQDYSPSSDLSRTAPIERVADISPIAVRAALVKLGRPDLAAQVPSMPQLPSGRALLDAGRQLLSPVTGAGVPTSDPVLRRYAELVLEVTGKTLDDPSNAHYLASVGDESEPLWAKALVQSRLAGAATNATGQVSPIQTTGQTATAAAAQASGGLPYSDYEIRNARTPGEARAMQLENARARSANPATATYHGVSGSDRKAMLLAAWDERHQGLKRLSPRDWAAQRAAYADTIR